MEELALVAQESEAVAVAGDVGMQPLKLADQRAFGLLVFGIELADFGVEQVSK